MLKKSTILAIILLFTISLFYVVNATDVLMNLNDSNTSNNLIVGNSNTSSSNFNNSASNDISLHSSSDIQSSTEQLPTTTEANYDDQAVTTSVTDYLDSGDLSVTNIINIILIVVGVVLILLGIAIIIKLKK